MYGAYAWRQSEKKVRSGSPRGVKSLNDCRARLHQRVARNAGEIRGVVMSSSRKRPRRRPRNNEKKNQRRHLALRSRHERRVKVDDNALILRVLYCAKRSRTRTHRCRCPRKRRRCRNEMFSFANIAFLNVEQAGYNLAARVPGRS